jgi:hypothetical protein
MVLLGQAVALYNRINALPKAEVEQAITEYKALEAVTGQVLAADPGAATALFLRALASAEIARKYDSLYRAAYGLASQAPADRDLAPSQQLKMRTGEYYQRAHRDMEALLKGTLVDEFAIARLVDAVIQVKLASYAGGTEREQEQARKDMLQQAQRAVQAYLAPEAGSGLTAPTGLNRVRAEFTLGVILYRQSVRPEQPNVSLTTSKRVASPAKLDEAAQQFGEMDQQAKVEAKLPAETPDRPGVARQWASYASFYLGLTRTWQANLLAERGQKEAALNYYSQARQSLALSYEYDTGAPFPRMGEAAAPAAQTQPASPLTSKSDLIYALVDMQWDAIDKSVQNLSKPAALIEDLQFDWTVGLAYDTNVPLLGDNVAAPRNLHDDASFRIETGFGMQYTVDMGKYDKRLERLSLAVLARAAAGWNADVPSYNPQDYGTSVAARYALYQPSNTSEAFGPLYGSIQYDFDYFLLGNQDFVHVNRLYPHLTLFSFDQRGQTDLGFTYENRQYEEQLASRWFDRTGDYYTVVLTHSQKVLDLGPFYEERGLQPKDLQNDPDPRGYDQWRWVQPFVGLRYGWDITDGREYDADWFLLTAGVAVPLPKGWTFVADGQWEWQDYNSHSKVDFHRRGRVDRIQRYGIGVQRRFVLNPGDQDTWRTLKLGRVVMIARGDVRWIVDDSNVLSWPDHAVFSYDRAIYGMNLSFQLD